MGRPKIHNATDRPLKGSGSYPAIAKSIASRTLVRRFYSNTNVVGISTRKMKRLSRGAHKNNCENPIKIVRNQRLKTGQLVRRNGDIFDFLPKRCVQVRPIIPTLIKKDDINILKPYGSHFHALRREMSTNTSSSVCSPASKGGTRHIDVIVRIRPKNKMEEDTKTIVWRTTDTTLVFDPKEKNNEFYFKGKKQLVRNDFGRKRPNKDLGFGFDFVYGPESSNKELFDVSLKRMIDQVLEGFNCTIFAYGATGSGKTYTMLGANDTAGITVLMAEELYRRLEDMTEDYSSEVTVSYLEVYNETIKDLLKPEKELYIREDGKKGIIIPELTVHRPRGAQDLLKLLKTGNNARSQHATDLNAESSRSHAVFQIMVLLRQKSESNRFKLKTSTSRLFMVDLAGSERGVTGSLDGLRQREGANINKSLLALSNCINALADGKAHIPYRNSKLTRLLKDSLSGNCVTVMIANVSPSDLAFEDTHNTLHYANRAKNIKITCKQNCFSEELIEESTKTHISDLQEQIRFLTTQLEEERKRHEITNDQIKECQMGMGDGIKSEGPSPTISDIGVGRPISVVHNPVAVDHFLELMKRKSKLMDTFTDASVEARLHEWEMNWKKLKVDIADFLGKLDVTDPNFITLAKLKNSQSNLLARYPGVLSTADERKEKLSFVNEEIESVYQKYLKNMKLDQPFLTVTFQEFISHKKMEIDIISLEKLQKFYQQLSEAMFGELVNAEVRLVHGIKLMQEMHGDLKSNGLLNPEVESDFKRLLAPAYGCDQPLQPPKNLGRKFSIQEDICNLSKTIHRDVVNFPVNEPSLLGSSMNLIKQNSSDILPTTVSSGFLNHQGETSCKDTYYTSGDEHHQDEINEVKMRTHQPNLDTLESLERKFDVNSVHDSMESITTIACDISRSSSSDNFSEMVTEFSDSENLNDPEHQIKGTKTYKPMGSITSRISPGSSYLMNESTTDTDRAIDDKPRSRVPRRNLVIHKGNAITDITLGATNLTTHRSDVSVLNQNDKVITKPPMMSSRNMHPIQEKDRPLVYNRGRPYTFMYKDTTSHSSFEQ